MGLTSKCMRLGVKMQLNTVQRGGGWHFKKFFGPEVHLTAKERQRNNFHTCLINGAAYTKLGKKQRACSLLVLPDGFSDGIFLTPTVLQSRWLQDLCAHTHSSGLSPRATGAAALGWGARWPSCPVSQPSTLVPASCIVLPTSR